MFSYYAVLFLLSSSFALERPSVTTNLGTVNGQYKKSYDGRTYSAFEGIPFAKPPVGKLRFEAPVEPDPWKKTLDADKIYVCPQNEFFSPKVIGTEDCLYLNVYVPKDIPNSNDNMHVIVHIHGGAFMLGSSTVLGPDFFMDRDVIFVNLNYRLGALGFLSTEDDVVPGNNGLKDQSLALKWIQNNIKQFGGNPKSVTITGGSAGGVCVHFHYFSKMSKGLFHRGISQGGTALAPWALQEGGLERTKALAVLVGCKDTTTTRTLIDCLKEKSSDEIVDRTNQLKPPAGEFPISLFAPVVEQKSNSIFLEDYPYKLLNRGEFHDLPWIDGMCTDEGYLGLAYLSISKTELEKLDEKFNELCHYYMDYNYTACDSDKKDIAQKIREQYFGPNKVGRDSYKTIIKVFGDRLFGFSFEKSARIQASKSNSKIYSYIYGYKSSFSAVMAKMTGMGDLDYGVGHGEDQHLLYGFRLMGDVAMNAVLSKTDELLKDMMVDMFISFADSNMPKINGLDIDAVSNSKEFTYVSIKGPTDIKMNITEELTPTKFWESLPITENEKFLKKYCNENALKNEL